MLPLVLSPPFPKGGDLRTGRASLGGKVAGWFFIRAAMDSPPFPKGGDLRTGRTSSGSVAVGRPVTAPCSNPGFRCVASRYASRKSPHFVSRLNFSILYPSKSDVV